MKVYADNAATTKISDAALEKLNSVMKDTFGNPSSLYKIGQNAKKVLEDSREEIATLIGASPKEIFFSSGGSESDNWAIISAAVMWKREGKKNIIYSLYHSSTWIFIITTFINNTFIIIIFRKIIYIFIIYIR